MKTLILNSDSKKDLELIREIALKFGIVAFYKREETFEEKKTRLLELAKRLDESIVPNDITMEEIVEEVRLAREERSKYGKENNS